MIFNVDSITKIYGKGDNAFVALDKVSLNIKRGESIAILGKSGSGKSTLMHVLAALDRVNSGEINFDKIAYQDMSAKKLDKLRSGKFGFIFQQFFLNGRETVLENVMLPLKIAGTSRGDRKARATQALEEVDLLDKINNKAINLSGGQKQRVAIARAIVNEPEVIFADEPTGNLDSENGYRIVELLFRLNKQKDITLIIVTHDAELANMCQRQFVMKDGKLTETSKGKK
ncbi:MAG TPA: ABC transporter ATP-binding protein [Candidatus Saccharimonadales bacterium]|nr:ABC transporter ATP-binding protein [Candidatus Saccharimonadales bacterium]